MGKRRAQSCGCAAGEANLEKWVEASNFPWLCSNCWHKDTGVPLGGAVVEEAVVLVHKGLRIGIIGLIEMDWLACCTTVAVDGLDYTDFVEAGRRLATKLRAEEAVDLVVALTHFREPNDERLAAEAPEIDLVLGGHDHHYSAKAVAPTGTWYVKSGADFKWLSKVNLQLTPQPGGGVARGAVSVEKLEVTGDVAERADVAEVVAHYMDNLKAAMGRELGQLGVELDTRRAAQTRAVSGLRRTAQPPGCGAHAPIAPVPGRRSGLRRCARRRRTGATGWRTSRARAAPRMWRSSTAGRCEQTWCTRRARRVQRAARGAGRRRPLAHQR